MIACRILNRERYRRDPQRKHCRRVVRHSQFAIDEVGSGGACNESGDRGIGDRCPTGSHGLHDDVGVDTDRCGSGIHHRHGQRCRTEIFALVERLQLNNSVAERKLCGGVIEDLDRTIHDVKRSHGSDGRDDLEVGASRTRSRLCFYNNILNSGKRRRGAVGHSHGGRCRADVAFTVNRRERDDGIPTGELRLGRVVGH